MGQACAKFRGWGCSQYVGATQDMRESVGEKVEEADGGGKKKEKTKKTKKAKMTMGGD
jgi:hypothetical protein